MNATDVILKTSRLGIELTVTPDNRISCKPKHLIEERPHLLEAIRANKQQLLFDVMLHQALSYLADHYEKAGFPDVDLSMLHEPEDKINDAYAARDLPAMRAAAREYMKAGVRAFTQPSTRR